MISKTPFILRAMYDWMVQNNLTPIILIDVDKDKMIVPEEAIDEEGIVCLNISPMATNNSVVITNTDLLCKLSINGEPFNIRVPIRAILSLEAEEDENEIFDFSQDHLEDNIIHVDFKKRIH